MEKNVPKEMSLAIANLRFPLCFMVVVIHSRMIEIPPPCSQVLYSSIYVIGEYICGVAVPVFTFFSSYLLFRNYEDNINKDNIYISIIKKKFFTLFIPFLFWNLIGLTAKLLLKDSELGVWERIINGLILYPADGPLWFIRNLIFFIIISPFLHLLLRKYSIVWLIVISVSYLLALTPDVFELGRTLPFFLIGAIIGIKNLNLISLFCKYINVIIILTFMFVLFDCVFTFEYDNQNQPYISYLMLILCLMLMSVRISSSKSTWLIKMGKYSFPVFAIHIFIVDKPLFIIRSYLSQFVNYDIAIIISFVLNPLIVTIICVYIDKAINCINPKLHSIVMGGR